MHHNHQNAEKQKDRQHQPFAQPLLRCAAIHEVSTPAVTILELGEKEGRFFRPTLGPMVSQPVNLCGVERLMPRGFVAIRGLTAALEWAADFLPHDSAERNEIAIAR